jgi:hypothetical protein
MSVNAILNAVVWLPWAVLGVGAPIAAFWLFEPAPIEITYATDHFISVEAQTRAEAIANPVREVVGGSVIYRWVEFCVRRPFNGTSHRAWVNEALVWNAPDLPTQLSRTVGCDARAFPVVVPSSSPARRFDYVHYIEVATNPLRTDHIEYPPLPLTILPPPK